jgi:hypothetical protein
MCSASADIVQAVVASRGGNLRPASSHPSDFPDKQSFTFENTLTFLR